MCGIVGFKSSKHNIDYASLLSVAWNNKHRGHKDGFGVVDVSDNNITKMTYDIEELVTESLHKDRGNKKISKGIVSYNGFDEEYYASRNEKFKKQVVKFKEKKSNFVLLHHRAASVGNVNLNNTHPISIDKVNYVHNGTIHGIDLLRNWLQMNEGWTFKGETDTEIAGTIIEHAYTKFNQDPTKVYDYISKLFPYFGVIIRISGNDVTIFKDHARSLWFYRDSSSGEILWVSEPLSTIKGNYDQLYRMEKGVYKVGEPFGDNFTDYTERWVNTMSDYDAAAIKHCSEITRKCDDCKIEKPNVIFFTASETTRKAAFNICFECYVSDKDGVKWCGS